MATSIALAAIGVFAAGVFAGVVAVVSVAIRREERNLSLTSGPTDAVTWAGRWLNGVYVRTPRPTWPGTNRRPLANPHPALTQR
jgi:hypothetical protein